MLLKSDLDIQQTHLYLFDQRTSLASDLGSAKVIIFIAKHFITVVLLKSDLVVQQSHLWFVAKSSGLAPTLGVPKNIIVRDMSLVSFCFDT